jgi:NADH-quinone oxidoreductase subunit N
MLESIRISLERVGPELILAIGTLTLLVLGLVRHTRARSLHAMSIIIFVLTGVFLIAFPPDPAEAVSLFNGMATLDGFGYYFKFLFCISGILTVVITMLARKQQERLSEYYVLILSICLGANLLVSSTNLLMTFLALELISIPSYVLAGFTFTRNSSEGSLKYFIFGAVASAIMLYGMSLLYGITGTLQFSTSQFADAINLRSDSLLIIAVLFTLGGFLYKVAAAPMHPWAPDVYEGAPMAVVAFFSTVPKLAGVAILARFIYSINISGPQTHYWQIIVAGVSILTIAVGNFSALWQKNPKRLMAYSSIAQSGFMLVGIVVFPDLGLENLLFYATVFVVLNYLVFLYLSYFEDLGVDAIPAFAGYGPAHLWPSVFILAGLVGLTGLPPTAGFTSKLLIFSGLWQAYTVSQKSIMVVLLVWGLLNTVVSLFYYLRIPYYSFIKRGANVASGKIVTWQNLFGVILVLVILILFFSPGLLMGWINKINFVF